MAVRVSKRHLDAMKEVLPEAKKELKAGHTDQFLTLLAEAVLDAPEPSTRYVVGVSSPKGMVTLFGPYASVKTAQKANLLIPKISEGERRGIFALVKSGHRG